MELAGALTGRRVGPGGSGAPESVAAVMPGPGQGNSELNDVRTGKGLRAHKLSLDLQEGLGRGPGSREQK